MPMILPDWPDFGLSDDIRPTLRAAVEAGKPAALVTLFSVEGGGPRPPGTQMLFAQDLVTGFLSGGCVEGDVAGHAALTLADGEPRWLVYGEGGPWPDIRLLCGARIELLVEKIEPDDAAGAELLQLWDARRPALWSQRRPKPSPASRPRIRRAPRAVAVDQPFRLQRRFDPTPRLAVVGADPTALAIASLGALSGMETTLIRPKGPASAPADRRRRLPAQRAGRLAGPDRHRPLDRHRYRHPRRRHRPRRPAGRPALRRRLHRPPGRPPAPAGTADAAAHGWNQRRPGRPHSRPHRPGPRRQIALGGCHRRDRPDGRGTVPLEARTQPRIGETEHALDRPSRTDCGRGSMPSLPADRVR